MGFFLGYLTNVHRKFSPGNGAAGKNEQAEMPVRLSFSEATHGWKKGEIRF